MQKVVTTFIAMFDEPIQAWLNSSIIARAQRAGILAAHIESILAHVGNNHHAVDDTPYGGGAGELMKIDVIAPIINSAVNRNQHIDRSQKRVILMDPAGARFNQNTARRLATYQELIFVCGRYEGIDARIHHYVDEALSLGDFVLSGGDVAAIAMCDATMRMIPGVLHNPLSIAQESHMQSRLEASQYTRPKVYDTHAVPAVLQSGDHQAIDRYRLMESALKTKMLRPDLITSHPLSKQEQELLTHAQPDSCFPWAKYHD